MRALPLLVLLSATVAHPLLAQTTSAPRVTDPYIWLEEKDSPTAMQWVAAENAKTLPKLEGDPRYPQFYQDAYAIASAEDRIPYPVLTYGRVYNFWRDGAHPHGTWRWTTEASYRTATPAWTTVLDIDSLGKAEGKNWVWQGANCLQPEERLCLLALSDGGEDATTFREFDLGTGTFVTDGFVLPLSKQGATWLDANTLLVARDWGPGTMTASGYAFVVKTLSRGQALEQAKEVFRGQGSDQVGSWTAVLTDGQGHRLPLITRGVTFFGHERFAYTEKGAVPLPLPQRMAFRGMVDGRVIISTSEDWTTGGKTIPAGALLSVDRAQFNGGPMTPTVLFQPTPRQSLDAAAATKTRVVAFILDNVRSRVVTFTPNAKGWTSSPVTLPDNASIDPVTSTERSDDLYLNVTSFITPSTLWSVNAATSKATQVKAAPARFDASNATVEQFEATSPDGTKVPYFIVHRKDIPLDGSTPTIMTGYGGFEVSYTPFYSGITGKLWVEQGGSFVVANIRGGGEFGPAWHEAGRKTKRQVIYDDFAAVAQDIFARKLSSPAKFGIYGGSNGGLLMGVEMEQHPDLWNAVVIQVPLLDMMRYELIQAGASWVDEYGSASVPEEAAFLQTISPYQNLKAGVKYPEPYIWTTTKDDRVGPQHARKFAARMSELGLPYLFYEDTAGGHSGDADIAQGARLQALQMTYFSQKLIGPGRVE
jgi:prolyl oligopeptidase